MSVILPEYYKDHILNLYLENTWVSGAVREITEYALNPYEGSVLEVGTGAGNYARYLESLGFSEVTAIDIIPEMIERAREVSSSTESKVNFEVGDAVNLSRFKSNSFDHLVYFGNVLSMIPEEFLPKALEEAYRVGKTGANYVFTFCDWESKRFYPFYSRGLNLFRRITGQPVRKFYLPEFRINGNLNRRLLKKDDPCIYWAKDDKVRDQLKAAGFRQIEIYRKRDQEMAYGISFFVVCKK